ncbi:transposase IS116/IS110/IS902 family protein [Catenulispora acidiphila DSM 44928]|uniref:Transposase IS116/IS110/IS902 family protein n=2 Tax=Catenulispora TaxID=414878 RepID=C7Q980_CATAD|nr:transposase IS116/IS110/IS902 family protein [Catenulispora acidiphila DSM 44928]
MDDHAEVVELAVEVEQVGRVAAIDVAKASGMVCTRLPSETKAQRRVQRVWAVAATTDEITALGDHLVCQGVELVVMEATGVFWRPWFYLLEDRGLRVWLVNARDVKNVPSRPKTDKLDAIWLAKLAERGMLRASFVPPEPVRRLRDLTRLRRTLVEERTRYRQRVADVLQDACLKVADPKQGLTDLFGMSGRAILAALVAGQRDPKALAALAMGRAVVKTAYLEKALAGRFTAHHGFLVGKLLDLHDRLENDIAELNARIEAMIAELDRTPPPDDNHPDRLPLLDRLDEIPGVSREIAADILGETGFDMTVFPTGGHLASWAKLTPRTIQSGARNSHGGTGKGNRWIKGPLGQAAQAAGRTKTFLGARYKRIVKHAPAKKAQVAVARNILEIAWVLINDPDARFTDLGPDWHTRRTDETRKTRQHIRELEHLGYTVTLTKAA